MKFTTKTVINIVISGILIIIALIAILFGLQITLGKPVGEPKETIQIQAQLENNNDLWKEAERNNQPNSLNIEFNEITTEPHWYALMSTYTTIFANKLKASEDNPNVIVAPELIPKDTYMDVDGKILNNIDYGDTAGMAKPDSSIYFQGAYLGKYLSESGYMESIIASLSDDGITVGEEGNQVIFDYTVDSKPAEPIPTESINSDGISEQDYLNTIKELIEYIYAPTSESDLDKAKDIANRYFTSECTNDIISNTNKYNPDSKNTIEIVTILAGKSDISLSTKDRVYVRFKLTNGENEYTLSLEIKLNNQQRVFDIDLI